MISPSDLDGMISRFFRLREFVHGDFPDAESAVCLVKLANWILDPLRVQFGPLRVTSGYRSVRENDDLRARGLGASKTSQHLRGCAADIQSVEGRPVADMMIWLAGPGSILPYDQAIDELRTRDDGTESRWLHIGMKTPETVGGPRHQLLVQRVGAYAPWVVD